jgi:hypothetical protein
MQEMNILSDVKQFISSLRVWETEKLSLTSSISEYHPLERFPEVNGASLFLVLLSLVIFQVRCV